MSAVLTMYKSIDESMRTHKKICQSQNHAHKKFVPKKIEISY